MKTRFVMLAVAGLLFGSGGSVAQNQTPTGFDRSDSAVSSHPEAHPQSTTPDRPPAASMPDTNKPSPEVTGQAPASSEKMEPGMDIVGGAKTAPGEEKK